MVKVNAEVLYGAYEQIASTPISEDATCGLMISADRCGHIWADGEVKAHREFISRHQKELVKSFHESKAAFLAAVEKGMAEDNAAVDAGFTHE